MDETTEDSVDKTEYMLTTVDNPYDPFIQFDLWYVWDQNSGYCTPGLLARLAHPSDEISEADQFWLVQDAINEIAQENVSGVHLKVKRGDVVPSDAGDSDVEQQA